MAALQSREPVDTLKVRLTQDGGLARIREQLRREKTASVLVRTAARLGREQAECTPSGIRKQGKRGRSTGNGRKRPSTGKAGRILNGIGSHGGRADEPGRARLRHLFPSATRQHHLSWHAHRRPGRQSHRCADALSAGRGSGEGRLALHQLSGRLHHRRPGHLRHHAVHQEQRGHLLHRAGGQHGRILAAGRHQGKAVCAAQLAAF